MATRRRRRPKRKRGKLVLLWLPIVLLLAILAWLFLEDARQLLGSRPTRPAVSRPATSKQPPPRDTEKILDPERKKLDEILKNR